jgi:ABC-type sugar transport system substrate-binding protein
VKDAAELNVKMNLLVAGESAQQQSSQIDTCIAQKVAGIVSIPWDVESVLSDIQRAKDAKIPFGTIDQAPSNLDTVAFHISGDPLADGTNAGKRLVNLVGDKPCKVVDLQGALDQVNGQMRDKGLKDVIKDHSNITIVSEVPTNWQPAPALAGMENALQANPDLCAVYSPTDGLLPPIYSALQGSKPIQEGRRGRARGHLEH